MNLVSEAIVEGLSERKSGGNEDDEDEDEKMEMAAKRGAKKDRVKAEVPSTDEDDVEDMRDAKKPVRQKSKKQVLKEEE